MEGIIDRFESEFAVIELEDGKKVDLKRSRLPQDAKEGDVIKIGKVITINHEKTADRKKGLEKLVEPLWEE